MRISEFAISKDVGGDDTHTVTGINLAEDEMLVFSVSRRDNTGASRDISSVTVDGNDAALIEAAPEINQVETASYRYINNTGSDMSSVSLVVTYAGTVAKSWISRTIFHEYNTSDPIGATNSAAIENEDEPSIGITVESARSMVLVHATGNLYDARALTVDQGAFREDQDANHRGFFVHEKGLPAGAVQYDFILDPDLSDEDTSITCFEVKAPTGQIAEPAGTAGVTGSGQAWSNPTNALTYDNTAATASVSLANPTTEFLLFTNFDFTDLPADAVIDEVYVNFRADGAAVSGYQLSTVQAWDGSSAQGTNVGTSSAISSSLETDYQYGAANAWSWWTAARLKTTTNGIQVQAEYDSGISAAVAIFYAELVVHYSSPSASPGIVTSSSRRIPRLRAGRTLRPHVGLWQP